ncbi:MAG: acetylxylan esterase [Bacteroidales bacterium]|nr:acetylxylan esterase [Bacteroidales bacterium]
MKKYFLMLASAAMVAALALSCHKADQEEDEDVEIEPLKCELTATTDNWIFESKPEFTLMIENPNKKAVEANVHIWIATDKKEAVKDKENTIEISGNSRKKVNIKTNEDFEPGFYTITLKVDKEYVLKSGGFGISPFKISSPPDMQPDFDSYWAGVKAQLPDITNPANVELTEIPSKSSSAQKAYLVEMKSVPDGPTGEPVTVRGYYFEPQGSGKYPVIMHFYGYDSNPPGAMYFPSANPKYAEFYLSNRGQMINARSADKRGDGIQKDFTNTYGDWFAFQFGQGKDGWFYRGAFMDCVQAVNFMATRPTSDMKNLFAEGSSQGGAYSYAAAALSDYPFTAIAPCVAFLGDFPDYFQIVSWPGNTARENQGSMSDEEMYRFLSYFDTKNLATRINAAVIACSGLQDGTCPPHTNTAPFNNLPTADKKMYYYPQMGHSIPSDWTGKYTTFFNERIK